MDLANFKTAGLRLAAAGILSGCVLLATSTSAGASVSITVPGPATVSLGAVATGFGTLSAHVGTVVVTAVGIAGVLLPTFNATVSSTSFTTGGGTSAETVPKSSVSYWSGPVTASTGGQTPVPGQLTAVQALTLTGPRTAFASSGLITTITTSWNPTIVITIPATAVAGTYTGTITHSVA